MTSDARRIPAFSLTALVAIGLALWLMRWVNGWEGYTWGLDGWGYRAAWAFAVLSGPAVLAISVMMRAKGKIFRLPMVMGTLGFALASVYSVWILTLWALGAAGGMAVVDPFRLALSLMGLVVMCLAMVVALRHAWRLGGAQTMAAVALALFGWLVWIAIAMLWHLSTDRSELLVGWMRSGAFGQAATLGVVFVPAILLVVSCGLLGRSRFYLVPVAIFGFIGASLFAVSAFLMWAFGGFAGAFAPDTMPEGRAVALMMVAMVAAQAMFLLASLVLLIRHRRRRPRAALA